MSTFTTYLDNALIAHALGKTSYTMPTVYVGLSTSTPAVGGTGVTEPTIGTNGYARVATSGLWGAASSGNITNSSAITFPAPTGSWSASTCTYLVFYDAATAGNLLMFEPITTPFTVNASNASGPSAAIGQVSTTIA